MSTKEKIRRSIYRVLSLRSLGVEVAMAVIISLFLSTQVFALLVPVGGGGPAPASAPKTTKTNTGGAKCAILDQGRVTCPSNNKFITGGCWYKDLGYPNAGPNKDGWQHASSCSNGIFTQALCPPGQPTCQVTASEDPALRPCTKGNCDLVKTYVDPFINVLAAAVGVVVTISIVIGGIQYSSSAGDPGKMQAARRRITNAIVALIGFFLFYAVLQWLIPGGFLNG